VFALLGEPGRFRLLVAVLEGGEPRVSDLAAATALPKSGQSRLTAAAGAPDRVGPAALRVAPYSLNDAHVRMLLDLGRTRTQHSDVIHPETHCDWTGSVNRRGDSGTVHCSRQDQKCFCSHHKDLAAHATQNSLPSASSMTNWPRY